MIRMTVLGCALAMAAAPAVARADECAGITDAVWFCPMDTLWDGLPWHRLTDPDVVVWETADMALMINSVPVVIDGTSEIEFGPAELGDFLDTMAQPGEGSEEIARFAPLGEAIPAYSRVTRQPDQGTVEYVTLYSKGADLFMIKTIMHADKLTQDHGLRHEHALKSLVEVPS